MASTIDSGLAEFSSICRSPSSPVIAGATTASIFTIERRSPSSSGEFSRFLKWSAHTFISSVTGGKLLPRELVFTPVPVDAPPHSSSRVMLYLDEKGVIQGTLPLQEDQVVMSFEGFVSYFRKKGWIVLPRDEVAKGLLGAVDNLH